MRGNLSDFNVESLLQVLGSSRATGALEIAHPTGRHFIAYLESGKLVHAQYDTEQGVDALAALMLEQSGKFEFKPGVQTTERTIQGAAEWTLMSAMNKADTRPPALRSEVTIKRKTGSASLDAGRNAQSLGRTSRPADSPAPRSVKSAAGSDATKLEALETMLKGSIFNVSLGASKTPQQPSRSLNVTKPTETQIDPFETTESLKIDFEFEAVDIDKPEPPAPMRATNPTHPTNPSHPSGSHVAPTAHGVAFIPISVSRATDATDKRSRLPARIVRDWEEILGRQITRMEFRIDLTRRGLVLPIAADDTPDESLVLPLELADRFKLSSGAVVWVGPG